MWVRGLLLLCLAGSASSDATLSCGPAYLELDAGASVNVNSPDFSSVNSPCMATIVIVPPQGYHVECQPTSNCFSTSALRNHVDIVDGNGANSAQPPKHGSLASCPADGNWAAIRSRGPLTVQTGLYMQRSGAPIVPILSCTAEQDGPTNCGGDLFVSAFNPYDTYFYSPGWPNNYPASCSCTWNVYVESGTEVSLMCDQFSTENGFDQLHWTNAADGSNIMNACDNGDPVSGTGAACSGGWLGPVSAQSTLSFTSDSSVQRPGFRCQLRASASASMRRTWATLARGLLPPTERRPVALTAAAAPLTSAVLNEPKSKPVPGSAAKLPAKPDKQPPPKEAKEAKP